jgi:hypothetical protein
MSGEEAYQSVLDALEVRLLSLNDDTPKLNPFLTKIFVIFRRQAIDTSTLQHGTKTKPSAAAPSSTTANAPTPLVPPSSTPPNCVRTVGQRLQPKPSKTPLTNADWVISTYTSCTALSVGR